MSEQNNAIQVHTELNTLALAIGKLEIKLDTIQAELVLMRERSDERHQELHERISEKSDLLTQARLDITELKGDIVKLEDRQKVNRYWIGVIGTAAVVIAAVLEVIF